MSMSYLCVYVTRYKLILRLSHVFFEGTSFIISGNSPFTSLFNSIARAWMFRMWIVNELSLVRCSS